MDMVTPEGEVVSLESPPVDFDTVLDLLNRCMSLLDKATSDDPFFDIDLANLRRDVEAWVQESW
jgi:hypothetical protein